MKVLEDELEDLMVCYVDDDQGVHQRCVRRFGNEIAPIRKHNIACRLHGESGLERFNEEDEKIKEEEKEEEATN